MDKDLLRARYERALKTIEQFGPVSDEKPSGEVNRIDLLRWVLDHIKILHKATKKEIAEVAAIIEQCERRQ
jgi:hypothetical protein